MAARTPTDDPEAIQRLAEPVVMDAVIAEMSGRGMSHTIDAPDVTLKWYLLLSLGTESQTLGQFLPPVAQWGIPIFPPSTQSLKIIQQGSLAIDVFSKESSNGAASPLRKSSRVSRKTSAPSSSG